MSDLESKPYRSIMAEFVIQTKYESLPPEVVTQVKKCVLDLTGVALATGNSELGQMALKLAQEMGRANDSSVWGTGEKLSAPAAVFVNAMRGHIMDMDDGHRYSNMHIGVVTVPVAVALGERENVTGKELIEAIAVGYEISIRLASFVNPGHLKRGFHTTSTIGVFAAAAVAAKILKLSQTETENCFSLAGLQSAGLLEALNSGHMGKSFQVGRAAQNGVWAAFAAKLGIEGPERIIEGKEGFLQTYASGAGEPDELWNNMGMPFKILSIYFKKHAACRHIHPSLDGIAILREQMNLHAEDVIAIDVETYAVTIKLTGKIPKEPSGIAAKFSLPLSVGLMFTFGEAGPDIYTDQNANHPLVRKIADCVSIHLSPHRDALYPAQRGSKITIKTKNGTYSQEVNYPKGEPENPFEEAELIDKFKGNTAQIFQTEEVELLVQNILNLENINIRYLTDLMNATKNGTND